MTTTATLSEANGSIVGGATHEFEVAVTLKDDRGTVLGTVVTPWLCSRVSTPRTVCACSS
jgi:hypothetical protein